MALVSTSNTSPAGGPSLFRRRHRISGDDQFAAVFEAKLRKSRGPITVFLLATQNQEHRLGLSIGRRVGNAVVRGRFKRMMREVFRHQREQLPTPTGSTESGSYDIVVSTRRHDPLTLEEYTRLFVDAVEAAHRTHQKRAQR